METNWTEELRIEATKIVWSFVALMFNLPKDAVKKLKLSRRCPDNKKTMQAVSFTADVVKIFFGYLTPRHFALWLFYHNGNETLTSSGIFCTTDIGMSEIDGLLIYMKRVFGEFPDKEISEYLMSAFDEPPLVA